MLPQFRRILVIHSQKHHPNHWSSVRKILSFLQKFNPKVVSSHNLKSKNLRNKDLVITLGGDGVFIRASHYIMNNTPILGINSEPESSEGFLTSLHAHELNILKNILQGNYQIKQRYRIQVKRNGQLLPIRAINEVYVGTDAQFHTSRYIIHFKGKQEEHRSSGVLVVTESGSNAWYKSAGGTPFNQPKQLAFLVREPYHGKRIYKPTMLHGFIQPGEKISFTSKRHHDGLLALDSNVTFPFNAGTTIELTLAKEPLNVITQ